MDMIKTANQLQNIIAATFIFSHFAMLSGYFGFPFQRIDLQT